MAGLFNVFIASLLLPLISAQIEIPQEEIPLMEDGTTMQGSSDIPMAPPMDPQMMQAPMPQMMHPSMMHPQMMPGHMPMMPPPGHMPMMPMHYPRQGWFDNQVPVQFAETPPMQAPPASIPKVNILAEKVEAELEEMSAEAKLKAAAEMKSADLARETATAELVAGNNELTWPEQQLVWQGMQLGAAALSGQFPYSVASWHSTMPYLANTMLGRTAGKAMGKFVGFGLGRSAFGPKALNNGWFGTGPDGVGFTEFWPGTGYPARGFGYPAWNFQSYAQGPNYGYYPVNFGMTPYMA